MNLKKSRVNVLATNPKVNANQRSSCQNNNNVDHVRVKTVSLSLDRSLLFITADVNDLHTTHFTHTHNIASSLLSSR